MNKAEEERRAVGLTPQEVREINMPKSTRGIILNNRVKKAVNVTAAVVTGVGGVGLLSTAQEAPTSTPASIVQEQKPDPKRDNPSATLRTSPPEGIIFENVPPSFAEVMAGKQVSADAPVEPVLTKKVFIPNVSKEYRQLWPQEFGAPERGVSLFNRGTQKGVKIEDQQLFENLMYFREKYGRPDLKLEIYFYDVNQINRLSGISPYDPKNNIVLYDFWATSQVPIFDEEDNFVGTRDYPPTFVIYGDQRFRLRDGSALEFHVSLPERRQAGVDPTPEQIRAVSIRLTQVDLWHIFMSHETGRPSTDRPIDRTDVKNYWPTKGPHSAFSIIIK